MYVRLTAVSISKHVVAVKKLNSTAAFVRDSHSLLHFFALAQRVSHSEGNTPGGDARRESKRFSLFIPAIISDNVAR